ncbi:hypothetical protein CANARDRAFT_26279 [[Candida] arabinofermentans NRRL YB-2248]|uniref:ATP-dependent RNA helicase n=1 Tax=[Candida] arabinofermentans NRRL YB-2248 TaxID=983967 RepID=A0A1E4T8P9_9ASCO|nr:hypothetical protein CANARDRAFT_26279 [[Candida] arabinofermentans NRRL YB-2248]
MDFEDGLMLNFAAPSSTTVQKKSKSSVKASGGSWKERRKNQLILEGRGRTTRKKNDPNSVPLNSNRQASTTTDSSDRVIPGENPERKKIISSEIAKPAPVIKKRHQENLESEETKKIRFAESRGESGGKNNTYVSSLFTANPEISERKYENETEIENNAAPSNAPLADSTTFEGLGINELLNKHLVEHLRFQNPTKIQRSVIPRLLARDRDLFVQAQTGSGKTLAFALPIFQKLTEVKTLNRSSGLFALILTPTRELATQIYSVLESLTRCCHRIVPGIVIGGEKKKSEKARLRKGVNILVATPGRLADHIDNTENLDLSNVRYVVLDEGDRLMELGFEETITKILKEISSTSKVQTTANMYPTLPKTRLNILCSATIKPTVRKLGEISLDDAELVTAQTLSSEDHLIAKDENGEMMAPDQLVQQVLIVPPKLRLVTLSGVLKNLTKSGTNTKTMVFFSCSDSVDFHFIALSRNGKKVTTSKKKIAEEEAQKNDEETDERKSRFNSKTFKETHGHADEDKLSDTANITALTAPLLNENTTIYKLHGSLSQQVRTSTLNHFANNTSTNTILLCTDVASRGLDLPQISNIIEFDPPFTIEDHLHRVGRTARAGSKGLSVLFLLPGDEENYLKRIESLHPNGLHFDKYESVLKEAFERPGEKGGNWDTQATTYHLDVERWLLDAARAKEIASNGFISHIRAYTTHLAAERDCFNVKKIHLGHLAKSFGLRETPKKVAQGHSNGGGAGSGEKKIKEDAKTKMLRMAKMSLNAVSDEFNIS